MSNVFDFIRARDPRYSNPLFNLLNAGKEVRQNVNNLWNNGIFGTPEQQAANRELITQPPTGGYADMYQNNFLARNKEGAPFSVPLSGFMAEMMPVLGDAIAVGEIYEELQKIEPNYYLIGAIGGLSVIPFLPKSATDAVIAGARSVGKGIDSASTAVVNRLNQRGEMPVVGSNFGNVGHNQGPPLETRPKFIQEYSPSLKAATELPQEKGTYNQMRSMLLKRGAKEEELIWSGFDKRFSNQEQVTKQELIDYLHNNTEENLIEEITEMSEGILGSESFLTQDELVDKYVQQNLDEEVKYFLNEHRVEMANESMGMLEDLEPAQYASVANGHGFPGIYDDPDQMLKWKEYLSEDFAGKDTIVDNDDIMKLFENEDEFLDYTMDEAGALEYAEDNLREHAQDMDIVDLRSSLGLQGTADLYGDNFAPYAEHYTPGAIDYTVTRHALNDPDNLRTYNSEAQYKGDQGQHWPDDDVIVHTRTSLFPLAETSGRAYHMGELQSDWSQEVTSMIKDARVDVEGAKKSLENLKAQKAEGFVPEYIKLMIEGKHVDSSNRVSAAKGDELIKDYYDQRQKMFETQLKDSEEFLANPTLTKGETDMLGVGGKAEMRKNYLARDVGDQVLEHFKKAGPKKFKEFEKDVFDFNYSQGKYKDSGLGKKPTQWMLEDRAGKFESFAADHRQILDYLMSDANTSDFAKSFKNKEYSRRLMLGHYGDNESLTFKEAYDRIRNESQDAQVFKDSNDKLAGGPTVGSTNKWVDFGLRKELRNAINSGAEYFTIGSPRMVKEMTGGLMEGQEEFYGKIVPGRLKKLIEKYDKNAKVEVIKIQTASDKPISPGFTSDGGVREVYAVKITDDLVNAIADKGGMPIFNFVPGAVGLTGTGILASQASQEDQPGGVLNQF